MSLRLASVSFVSAAAVSLLSLPAAAQAQTSASSALERAMLSELNAATRAEVERRATRGNTVRGVIGTMLLNNYYGAGARRPGQPLSVVAVDFSRGIVVLRRGTNQFEVQRFDPRTLRIVR
jgi:hypothetical protein